MQLSARFSSHATQATPEVPQVEREGVRHWPPRQQPLGHDCALHTQLPLTQRWPTAHWALLPHRQAPLVHALERFGSHATQATPPTPQRCSSGVGPQVLPEQQPVVHVALQPAHTPLLQV